MATQTLILHNPALLLCQPRAKPSNLLQNPALSRIPKPSTLLFKPRLVSFQSTFSASSSRRYSVNSTAVRACSSTLADVESPTRSLLAGSTRTVTTLLAIAITASKFLAGKILNFARPLKGCPSGLPQSIVKSVGPAFFAAIGDETAGSLNTPFTVVAAGMAKWLDIYSGVLMVRVLLSWFPNIPWDRQPFSAVRDLCDPYLNLFRNIIPPIFDTLDVSPLLAFAVLGTLGSILKSSRGGF